jgi:hypothetical protein
MMLWLLTVAISSIPMDVDVGLEPGEEVELILWLIVAAVSLIPVIFFSISYIRVRSTKLLMTDIAFILFFVKAVTLGMKLFIPSYSDEIWWSVAAFLDIMIISLIALALSKKA